ncbi:ABC transporter substrate-binding protein [Paenibacillus eucommiae]|uniref:N-acetylglucosamine transport system substrate-binding protein n=1 Tax=Paenibacillus eucommiae TaxID=1355755 RepID=A0ABS4ILU0_9BACL|nr:ABC transporter substrate-binding protein [Paenibacillus eucommiae]MBP1988536.1 N-acetylglucosamine transport system substrate-binding protein [Paenibacillus eucommiae]
MKRNVKWLAVMFALILMMSVAAACGSKDEKTPEETGAAGSTPAATGDSAGDVYPENGLSKADKVKIKLAIDENGYGRAWVDNAIEIFTKKYPNVSFDITSSPKIGDMVNTKVAANKDSDMFDIFPGTAAASTKLIEGGKLEAIDDLWERDVPDEAGKKLKDALTAGVYENHARYKGKTYNVPVGGYTAGMFFDINFFEENGWNQNPQTWDEFVQLLADIKAKNITPIIYAGVYPDYLYNFGFGAKPFELAEINGTLDAYLDNYRNLKLPTYTAPEYLETWKRISELGKKGYYADGVAAINHTQSQMQMLQHKAALVPTGDWVQNEMKDAIPEGFKWGFMAVPFGDKPDQTKWIMGDNGSGGLVIWANAPDLTKKWAKEFLLTFVTLEAQTFNAEHAGIFPIRADFSDDPERLAKMQDAPRAIVEYMNNHKTRFESMRKDVVIDHPAMAQATQLLAESANEMILGKKDYLPVFEKMDALLKQAIEANNK